ncbi:hypothetical protein SLEP1_g53474 [Rubroshorea leprosula]|uniref:HTH three-helical bundle domain-containing protein n=1 Tax=Rubroshorea leprosula TaxID=152421 RepID=A0AAV5MD16_9ROSI|nr:hypothetical protein SLEP1_g53474 [Rubroshorea leprosula]
MSTEASCLSSSSNAISNSRSKHSAGAEKKPAANLEKLRKKRGFLGQVRRRVEGILKLLSSGGFSEVTIRRVLGDCPTEAKPLESVGIEKSYGWDASNHIAGFLTTSSVSEARRSEGNRHRRASWP